MTRTMRQQALWCSTVCCQVCDSSRRHGRRSSSREGEVQRSAAVLSLSFLFLFYSSSVLFEAHLYM